MLAMPDRRVPLVLAAALFLDLLGFGMIIADFQLHAESMIPEQWQKGVVIGALLGGTFVIQTLISPLWGRWSDRVGRKLPLAICSLLSAAAMAAFGAADNWIWLLVSRLLSGLGGANVAIAQAMVTDTEEGSNRTAALGRLSAATTAGLVIGPPIGGTIASWGGHATVGYVAAGASLLGALLVVFGLPKPPLRQRWDDSSRRNWFNFELLKDNPALVRLVLIAVVAWFSLAMLEGTFARLIRTMYGFTSFHFGWIFGFESLLMVLVSSFLLGPLLSRFAPMTLLRTAFLAKGVGLAMNPFAATVGAHPFGWLMFASAFFAYGVGVANPVINSAASSMVPEDRHGELFGLLQSARSLGFVIGPILGGRLFDHLPIAPYVFAGGVCVVAALLVPRSQAATSKAD